MQGQTVTLKAQSRHCDSLVSMGYAVGTSSVFFLDRINANPGTHSMFSGNIPVTLQPRVAFVFVATFTSSQNLSGGGGILL
jgi:hypothetical protein